jgi:hypothetical protein
MGLDVAAVQVLCCAKSLGIDFSETLMIGRQWIGDDTDAFGAALSAIGSSKEEISRIPKRDFGEPIFRLLGARRICSMDASSYQEASYICDLNQPCPAHLMKEFSIVFDGGTLEHIFNIPQALKNCMEMVRVGGHFVQVTAANNFMGHGFWQFSPETIYRIFSRENGFLVKAVFLHEVVPGGAWYQVADPAICGGRVELINRRPTYICTIAERFADREVFAVWPHQSDYVEIWKGSRQAPNPQPTENPRRKRVTYPIRQLVPRPIKKVVRAAIEAVQDPIAFNSPSYRHISAHDLVHGRLG